MIDTAELITPERIRCNESVHSKKRALELAATLIAPSLPRMSRIDVFNALNARERLGSTGLRHGVAIPHGRVDNQENVSGAMIRLKRPIDFDALTEMITETLSEDLIVPPSDYDLPLEDLWQKSGRVLVLWNNENRPSLFGPKVDQVWKETDGPDELQDYIGEQMDRPHTPFWAMCAVIPAGAETPISTIPHLHTQLDAWFQPGNAWMRKANILSVDFFQESRIVTSCVGESYRRASLKRTTAAA